MRPPTSTTSDPSDRHRSIAIDATQIAAIVVLIARRIASTSTTTIEAISILVLASVLGSDGARATATSGASALTADLDAPEVTQTAVQAVMEV